MFCILMVEEISPNLDIYLFTENSCAKVTYYICTNCGYVEKYLDKEELHKLM